MADDCAVCVQKDGEQRVCRAKAGGKLYVNEWYSQTVKNSDGTQETSWYYYGPEGAAAVGYTKVGSHYYFFDDYGYMYTSYAGQIDGTWFAADENGNAILLSEGWNLCGSHWYYFTGSELYTNTIVEINGQYYAFDRDGILFEDVFITANRQLYRARKGGSLYVNSWYYWTSSADDRNNPVYVNGDKGWFYFGYGGVAVNGLQTIDGVDYLFYNGMLATDTMDIVGDKLYVTDSKGVARQITEEGLYYLTSQNETLRIPVYVSDQAVLQSTWKDIGDKRYFFDGNGHGLCDGIFWIDGTWYAFHTDGTAVMNEWVIMPIVNWQNAAVYYADDSGRLVRGEQKIDGKWYYFNHDCQMTRGIVSDGDKQYLYGMDGVYIGPVSGNGWNKINGIWYYVRNDQVLDGAWEVDGFIYCFQNGRMRANEVIGTHLYGKDGKRIQGGWYKMNGLWYYVDPETQQLYDGTIIQNGKEYLLQQGIMFTGEDIYVDNGVIYHKIYGTDGTLCDCTAFKENGWTLLNGVYYYAKYGILSFTGWIGAYYVSNGIMQTNTITPDGYYVGKDGKYVKSGWITPYAYKGVKNQLYKNTYYAKAGGKLAKDEWVKIGSYWYYFIGYEAVKDQVLTIQQKVYYFDEEGRQTIATDTSDGWKHLENYFDDWAYVEGGRTVYNGIRTINGAVYCFLDGIMVRDEIILDQYGTRTVASYYDSNGKRVTKLGWYQLPDGNWIYVLKNGELAKGFTVIDGKMYYFDPVMLTGFQYLNGCFYYYGDDGVLQKEIKDRSEWVKWGNNWYYYFNGSMAKSAILSISGKNYLFDETGAMVTNGITCIQGHYYYADAKGIVIEGKRWIKAVNGCWYYVTEYGYLATGIVKIDGVTYHFDAYGRQLE